jgi:putative lipoic acid-binding regulatory protein
MLHCIHELWFQLFFEGNVSISFVCRFNIRFLGAGGKQLNQELIVGVCCSAVVVSIFALSRDSLQREWKGNSKGATKRTVRI